MQNSGTRLIAEIAEHTQHADIGFLAVPVEAFSQARYPDRPIRLVVPFAPGGDGDLMGRLWAKYAGPLTGGTFVVENKAGAGGRIANEVVKAAPADGSTLLMTPVDTLTTPRTRATASRRW